MQILLYFTFLLSLCYHINSIQFNYEYVTCGSVLKLLNAQHNVRLHSHDVKYGQGSGQQSVTGVDSSDDNNSYWQVRERSGSTRNCIRGKPIKCGQTVRLMHLSTGRNLHSHHFTSPLTHNLEVSAFGENGSGDEGDDWIVQCSGGTYWLRNEYINLKHSNTHSYLHVNGERYGRPIEGQAEISCISRQSRATEWIAAEGVFVKPSLESNLTESNMSAHEEL